MSRKGKPLKKLGNTELITKYASLVGHNFDRVRFMAHPNHDKGVQLELMCRREILRRMEGRALPSRS